MTESQAILRLQEIDLELIRCQRMLDALPQRKKLQTIKVAKKRVASELTKIVGKRKDLEIDLSDRDEKRKRYEQIVTEVQQKAAENKDYRSIKDIEGQLSELAKALEKVEFESGRLMEELEKTERAEKNARDVQTRLDSEETSQLASLKADAADVVREAKSLTEERPGVVSDISAPLMKRYEAARVRFDGIAVESLDGNKPSACHLPLQASQYADIKRGDVITECPYCHRILVTKVE